MQASIERYSNPFLIIIGIGINPESTETDFFLLAVEDDSAIIRPIIHENYIVIFTDIKLADNVLNLANLDIINIGPAPQEETFLIDITQVLYLIDSQNIDNSATLLNFINVAIDLIKATEYTIPDNYYNLIIGFANYLTLNKEFSSYFQTYNIARWQVRDAIVWLIGALTSNVKVIDKSFFF